MVNAEVTAQVSGYLLRQAYKEGGAVKKGQLLFEIDPRPFQATLAQANGQLAEATAQFANAEAVQGRTQLDVDRYTPLVKEQAASQQDLDNAIQNNLAAKATVATAKAQIQAAEAAVQTAKLNLEFTRLASPIDGIAGVAQLQVGALVSPSSPPVTTVSTVDPIKVYFTVSEQEYLDWNRRFPTEASLEAANRRVRLELILADGTTFPHEGTVYFADRHRRAFSQRRKYSAPRGVWPGPSRDSNQAGCAARPPARSHGTTGQLPSGRGRQRQQG
jgi:membrane fusion protein (multidrug efflux system)